MTEKKKPDSEDFFIGDISLDKMREVLLENSMPSILESEFYGTWLPLFAGVTADKDAAMLAWTSVSRSVHQSVKVLDDHTGELKYIVPPLLRGVALQDEKAPVPVTVMLRNVSQLRDAGRVAQANQTMKEYFSRYSVYDVNVKEEIEVWNDIFSRYNETKHLVVDLDALLSGKPQPGKEEGAPESSGSAESTGDAAIGNDDMEF